MTESNSKPTATDRWDDINTLLQPFRDRVTALIARLTALDFDPVLFETYRSPERAHMLNEKGTGIDLSMHCFGVAADIICKNHQWSCHQHGCKFFESLGEQAEKMGLVWGGRWRRLDLPHVQGVTVNRQNDIRNAADNDAREKIVVACLGPVVP